MNHQRGRTLQDIRTPLAPAAVLEAAKAFFGAHSGVYSAFVEREGPNHLALRGQGGEEIVIAASAEAGVTRVSGSSYLFDQQIARFLTSLPAVQTEGAA
jgi:hypothetical protein